MKKLINHDFSTKSVRSARLLIFGFAAVWIVLFHLLQNVGFPSGNKVLGLLSFLIRYGNYGVDIFLILSGIGLCASMQKNTVGKFYYNRFKRVVIPYLTVAIVFFVWYDFIFAKDGVLAFLLNITTLNYWFGGDHPTWYVAFIIIVYALFPFIYKLDKKTKHIGTVLLIVLWVAIELLLRSKDFALYTNCERALSRMPVFLIGVIVSDLFWSDKKISLLAVPVSLIALGASFAVLYCFNTDIILQRYLGIPVAFSLIILLSLINSLLSENSKVLLPIKIIGIVSLETYISHVFIIRFMKVLGLFQTISPWKSYIAIIISTVILSYLIYKLTYLITKALEKEKRNVE